MLKEWFWLLKKIKSNTQFAEHRDALQAMLDAGQDLHERDSNGRSALEYVFAKPSPNLDVVTWLINQSGFDPSKETSLYPYSPDLPKGYFQRTVANNMMERLDNLIPTDHCNIEDIEEKTRLAQPYLLLLEKFENKGLTNPYQHNTAFYHNEFASKLHHQQLLMKLATHFDDLNIGFRMLQGEYINEFQSRIIGSPWLPESALPVSLVNNADLKLAFQINFAELNGLNPSLPSKGLLQVFIPEPEEGEDPINACESRYWTDAELASLDWSEHSDRALEATWLIPTRFERNLRTPNLYPIQWKSYTQLPNSEEKIALALSELGEQCDPDLYCDLQYGYGLMPRIEDYAEDYLPNNHIVILNIMYCDTGSSIYSMPADALRGDDTDWRQLTHTYCPD
ncbi:DUF1963 domain-containing protein [Photobacterium nomapromontoriensis]|uniref:DUF1963 domain-containing protein n=1 Tax=Photobacterium nomapromontoriensis TaxID=2910237 RepID=UPI003D0DA807